jgi:hypothetical protein
MKSWIGFRHAWMAAKRLSDTPAKGAGGRVCKPGHPFQPNVSDSVGMH